MLIFLLLCFVSIHLIFSDYRFGNEMLCLCLCLPIIFYAITLSPLLLLLVIIVIVFFFFSFFTHLNACECGCHSDFCFNFFSSYRVAKLSVCIVYIMPKACIFVCSIVKSKDGECVQIKVRNFLLRFCSCWDFEHFQVKLNKMESNIGLNS